MYVLALNGSPRKNGNTYALVSLFLKQADKHGFETKLLNSSDFQYMPCTGCKTCEKIGFCILKDSFEQEIFPFFRKADIIVLSTPVYFYTFPAQIKILSDRMQTLWSRKYRLKIKDSGEFNRKGILLSVGATKGENLFDGIKLTAKYFFDALGAEFIDSLCYRRIDHRGELENHPHVKDDIKKLGNKIFKPFKNRKTIFFVCRENAGRSQIAASFAKNIAQDKINVISAGSNPAKFINKKAVQVMAEKGLDIAFIKPCSFDHVIKNILPNIIITMGCDQVCPVVPGCKIEDWNLPDPADKTINEVRKIRDKIEIKVKNLVSSL